MRDLRWSVLLVIVAACTTPDKLVAGECGDGVVNSGEDCEWYSAETTLCGSNADGPDKACRFLCDSTKPLPCPVGYACDGSAGVCDTAPGQCGNGQLDPGEDCEVGVTTVGTCGSAGSSNACHFICSATIACPPGAQCAPDGRCFDAGGALVEAAGSPFPFGEFGGAFTVSDFNGDGNPDIISTTFEGFFLDLGAGDGTFPSSTVLPAQTALMAVGDFNGDGRKDVAVGAPNSFVDYDITQPDGSFDQVLFPILDVTALGSAVPAGSPDIWIGMRLDTTQPFANTLHIAFEPTQLQIGFDFDLDPAPVQIPTNPGGSNALFAFAQLGSPAFPVADAIADPSAGGDELAVGLSGDIAVRVYTAHADPATGFPTLALDVSLPLLSDTLSQPPLFADIDGDGNLDVVAVTSGSDGTAVEVAFGTGTGFAPFVVDSGLTQADCAPTDAAKRPAGGVELLCSGSTIETRDSNDNASSVASPVEATTGQGVFVDINHDGVPDAVIASEIGLVIEYGNPNGLFSSTLVHTKLPPQNLRVGDFDGDQIPDVEFVETTSSGSGTAVQLYVLFGSTGQLAAPVELGQIETNVNSVEPMLLVTEFGFPASATSDLVVDDVDPTTNIPELSLLFGDPSRTMDNLGFLPPDPFAAGFFYNTTTILAGHFGGTTSGDDLLFLVQDPAPDNLFALESFSLPTDANLHPSNRRPVMVEQASVSAFADGSFFCFGNLYATGDLNGDHIDDVVIVKLSDGSNGCATLATPQLLTLSTTTTNTNAAVPLMTQGSGATAIRLADFDDDGNLDLLIVFQGDATSCEGSNATFPCTNTGNEVAIIWGSSTGLTSQVTEVTPAPSSGAQQDAVPLRIDASALPELLVTTSTGLFAYDLNDRSYTVRATPIIDYTASSAGIFGFGDTLATGDVNGDGLVDLLLDDDGTMHVLLMQPAAMTQP